ncbi:hypothetical protein EWM64_g3793 [Hericium alpestre]|uniref:Uncharacterized protein n=1 Tax=Hericium alpestre TaxID=135208 RepID=A0A4Z0A2X4_9AGAM|nr:hypothetical protein EWM64_g3793 [Hericium alpestre]
MRDMFMHEVQRAKLDHVSSDSFRKLKTLFIIAQVFLQHNRDLDDSSKQRLTKKILEAQTIKHAQEIIDSHARRCQLAASAERRSSILGSAAKTVKSAVVSFTGWPTSTTNSSPSKESTITKEASVLEAINDAQFISDMKNFDASLGEAMAEITQIAQDTLRKMIDSLVNKVSHQAYAIQKNDFSNRLEMELRSRGDQEKQGLRSWLISEINKKSPPDAKVYERYIVCLAM